MSPPLSNTIARLVNATKWLLDAGLPITRIASGMVALTRIRASSRGTYVIAEIDKYLAIAQQANIKVDQ